MFAPPAPEYSGPSAPPANMFDNMPGYEGTRAGEGGSVDRCLCFTMLTRTITYRAVFLSIKDHTLTFSAPGV